MPPLTAHQLRLWRRRVAAFAVALLAAALFFSLSRDAAVPTAPTPSYGNRLPTLVDITLVHAAKDRGAVCLDGTPPAYHFQPGFGDGSDKWLLHLEGGSWCRSFKSCADRMLTKLGSSAHMDTRAEFVGVLSDDPSQNPDFYNWNKVKVRYCDGASFSGNVENEVKNGTSFFFRGQRIWEAVMDELLSKGLARAKQTGIAARATWQQLIPGLNNEHYRDHILNLLQYYTKVAGGFPLILRYWLVACISNLDLYQLSTYVLASYQLQE